MRLAIGGCLVAAFSLFAATPALAQFPIQKITLTPADSLKSISWIALTDDPRDGQRPRLPDAKSLSYGIDPKSDLIWFKVTVYEPLPERWFGINIAFETGEKPDTAMTWWGSNKIKFDRLATAYLFKAEDYWQGPVGVTDSVSVGRAQMSSVTRDVKVAIDREQRAIFLGIPRSALGTAPTVRAIATLGSNYTNNDDLPNEGMVTVKLKP